MLLSIYRNPTVWLGGLAPILKALSFILINGIFVPVAEEYLWRGIVQPSLQGILPAWLAVGITAVLFSFKHILVDASWGRFLALTAFGIICGILAKRKSWRSSAVLHIVLNTFSTLIGLVTGSI